MKFFMFLCGLFLFAGNVYFSIVEGHPINIVAAILLFISISCAAVLR